MKPQPALNTYKITLLPPRGRRIVVRAQYFRMDEGGNLVDSYPIMVRTECYKRGPQNVDISLLQARALADAMPDAAMALTDDLPPW